MKKSIIKSSISIFLILSFMLVFLTGCSNNEESKLKSKTEDELAHFENELLNIANNLNNISFTNYILTKSKVKDTGESATGNSEKQGNTQSKSNDSGKQNSGSDSQKNDSSSEGQSDGNESEVIEKYEMESSTILTNKQIEIDWEYIKYNVELLDSNWSTIVIDLHSLNVDNNDILNCGDTLNNLILSTKNEDKVKTLQIISDLYSYIPKYTKQYSNNTTKINLEYVKYFVLDAYTLVEEDKWNEMKNQIGSAKDYYSNIINTINGEEKNQNKINKVYILLNELDNSIDYKDKELFYIKYKALMENIESI